MRVRVRVRVRVRLRLRLRLRLRVRIRVRVRVRLLGARLEVSEREQQEPQQALRLGEGGAARDVVPDGARHALQQRRLVALLEVVQCVRVEQRARHRAMGWRHARCIQGREAVGADAQRRGELRAAERAWSAMRGPRGVRERGRRPRARGGAHVVLSRA